MVATAMIAAAKMGVQAEVVGAVGDDDLGQFALARFAKIGVDCERVAVIDGQSTATSVVLV